MNSFKKNIFKSSEAEILVFDPFDFMVVRFTYTKPTDGTDLDIMVYYDGTGTIYDKDAVGFNQLPNATKIPTDATPDTDAYLWWASDDVALPAGECVEAVVVGLDNFNTSEIVIGDIINVYLRVGWYNMIGGGTVDIELQTYLGGTMSKVGTNIINTGGVLVDTQAKTATVTSGVGQVTEAHSDLVGSISYNKITKIATLV